MNSTTTYEQELESRGYLICTTMGQSMHPFLHSGKDLVQIDRKTQQRCQKFDVVLYRRQTGKYVLHRIVKVLPGSYTLCGDNCWQREPGITDEQILGVLTGVIRNGKKIDVQHWRYRLLVHVWYLLYVPRATVLFWRGKIWSVLRKIKAEKRQS